MANTIQLKRSNVASRVPTSSDLSTGELALNMADSKLYFKDPSGTVKEIASGASASATTFPFYKADGTSDTIAITSNQFPFYKADGTLDNIGVS